MIAIEANFTVARYPIPLRGRLRRRNRTSGLFVDRATTFLIFPCHHRSRSYFDYPDATRSISAHTCKIDTFSNSGIPGTHVLRQEVSMARLVDTQLGIMIFLLRHSDEECVKFRHKQASPCQRSGHQSCEHALMLSVHWLHYVECAFGPGGKDSLMRPIVEHAVDFTADGECRDFASRVAIKHDQACRITATYKQPAVRLVKCHRVVDLCFRQLPSTDDFRLLRSITKTLPVFGTFTNRR